jgi:hypothetical protein
VHHQGRAVKIQANAIGTGRTELNVAADPFLVKTHHLLVDPASKVANVNELGSLPRSVVDHVDLLFMRNGIPIFKSIVKRLAKLGVNMSRGLYEHETLFCERRDEKTLNELKPVFPSLISGRNRHNLFLTLCIKSFTLF